MPFKDTNTILAQKFVTVYNTTEHVITLLHTLKL